MRSSPTLLHVEQLKKHPNLKVKLHECSQVSSLKGCAYLAADWILILAAIFLGENFFHPITYAIALLVIASRQHALLTLMHEGAHYHFCRGQKLNTWLCDLLAAFPVLFDTDGYRKNHLQHHSWTNTEKDPDWIRKIDHPEWQFPRALSLQIKDCAIELIRGGFIWLLAFYYVGKLSHTHSRRARIKHQLTKTAYYLLVILTLYKFNLLWLMVKYWLAALLLVFPALQRIRSISEHFGLKYSHELNATRNIEAGPLERFFFAPHSVNYHLVHHLFPSVPFYNLADMDKILKDIELYRSHAHINQSYIWPSSGSVLSDLLPKNS